MDGRLLRPKFKAHSPSNLEGASLALNLSSVMEDRAMLLGSSKPPQLPTAEGDEVSSTDDVDNTDIDSDYVDNTDIDDEVIGGCKMACLMPLHAGGKYYGRPVIHQL